MPNLETKKKDTDMTIKTQAYLQGYLHEKTAEWPWQSPPRAPSSRTLYSQERFEEMGLRALHRARGKRERIRRQEQRARKPVSPQEQRTMDFLKQYAKGNPAAISWDPRSMTLKQWAGEHPEYYRGGVLEDAPVADDTGESIEDYA